MLPIDTTLVTRGNDVVLMSKPCHQTSPVPYSNENRSKLFLSFTTVPLNKMTRKAFGVDCWLTWTVDTKCKL